MSTLLQPLTVFDTRKLIRNIHIVLNTLPRISMLECILYANVPIMKFTYNNRIEGDISISNITVGVQTIYRVLPPHTPTSPGTITTAISHKIYIYLYF